MKRLIAILLALSALLTISLTACGKKDDDNQNNTPNDLVENPGNNNTNTDNTTNDDNTTNGGEQNGDNQNGNTTVPKEMEAKNDTVYVLFPANIRAEANASATAIGVANFGDSFKRTGSNGDWSRIEFDGTTAYIFEDVLTTNKSTVTFEKYAEEDYVTVYVDPNKVDVSLNLRSHPWVPSDNTNTAPIAAIVKPEGELIQVGVSEDGEWAIVRLGEALVAEDKYPALKGKDLYCKVKFLTTSLTGEEGGEEGGENAGENAGGDTDTEVKVPDENVQG